MTFEAIAVTGMGCLLPGAEHPNALWQAVLRGQDLITEPPAARAGMARLLAQSGDASTADLSERGGYVTPSPAVERALADEPLLSGLDPLFGWMLYAARQALTDAGHPPGAPHAVRTGAIFGNLSFPTPSLTRWAEWVWLSRQDRVTMRALGLQGWAERVGPEPDARNRFLAGLPGRVLAQVLDLRAGAYTLDAACASSLYAVRLACERLSRGEADMMLAGGINGTDALCLHKGFGQLGAKSPTGLSRPFHRDADGLVASEGAAFVTLRRLSDAVAAGEPILGVIRGVGLSNDGGARGRLTPDPVGQVRAMEAAYAMAGLAPSDISFVECHATGTPVGDRTEAMSLAKVFGTRPDLAIGSLKSNIGHLVTAAGAAGMIKVLLAMRHRTRPPSRHADAPLEVLEAARLRLVAEPEPWHEGCRRAAVSAFGFGGANAHLILEEWRPQPGRRRAAAPERGADPGDDVASPVAVVGVGLIAADRTGAASAAEALFGGPPRLGRPAEGVVGGAADAIAIDVRHLRLPPSDIALVSPRDLALFTTAKEALAQATPTDPARTAVIIGTEAQTAVSRHVARVHLMEWLGQVPKAYRSAAADAFAPLASAATIAGLLPNMAANLLNGAFRITGPGYTVSSGTTSGLTALKEGVEALRRGEVDTALVGAADLSCEPVHAAAAAALSSAAASPPGDAAVALVLRRLPDALRRGDPVYAVLGGEAREDADLCLGDGPGCVSLAPRIGQAYAAGALVHVAAAALALRHGLHPGVRDGPARPWPDGNAGRERSVRVSVTDEEGMPHALTLTGHGPAVALRPVAGEGVADPPPGDVSMRIALHAPAIVLPEPTGFAPAVEAATGPPVPDTPEDSTPGATWMAPAPELPPVEGGPRPSAPPSSRSVVRGRPFEPPPPGVAADAAAPASPLLVTHMGYLARAQEGHVAYLAAMATYAATLQAMARPSGLPRPMPVPLPAAAPIRAPVTRPTPSPAAPPSAPARTLFDRAALRRHATGLASSVFGPEFKAIDGYRRVRMPGPPLLLADRVTGIRGEARSMGQGTVWTETRVDPAAWYMHDGAMAAGALVEAGQADLFLISYLGIDFLTKGERLYRLLGCDLTFHDPGVRAGDVLSYEITIDGHARQGDVRLFFFHYDAQVNGRPAITVHNGQAGFFTDEELRNTRGGLWTPAEMPRRADARVDRPRVDRVVSSLGREQVEAFARGDLAASFGEAFRLAATQVRPPRIAAAPLLLIDEVTALDVAGGPHGHGYMRAETEIRGDEWFFRDHFFGDPAMPGTLMAEGCLQAMSLYLAALGFSLDKDGWRFAPATERPYRMACRGQVTPGSRRLTYEVYVEELVDGPRPALTADVVVHVDGLQAFHCRALCVELTPDWPITSAQALTAVDLASTDPMVLHAAWGLPSKVFGEAYRPFDVERRTPRLPGPPYLFISRFVEFRGPRGGMQVGSGVDAEFDVRPDDWYFPDGDEAVMPLAALVEVALQPCGALSAYVGVPLQSAVDVHVRNLDGDVQLLASVPRRRGTLHSRVALTSLSTVGATTLSSFHVTVALDGVAVAELDSVFGHFTADALAQQTGFGRRPEEGLSAQTSRAPQALVSGRAPLSLLERLLAWQPGGGQSGLGYLMGEMDVDPSAWFFRAHFYQDPVQPGSLGVEAMVDLVKEYLVRRYGTAGGAATVFRPLAPHRLSWQYRGQVVARNRRVQVEVEITEAGWDEHGPYAYGDGRLWVDGTCIYRASHLGVGLANAAEPSAAAGRETWLGQPEPDGTWRLEPSRQPWILDHCPTFTRPVLPMAGMADLLAQAALACAPGAEVVRLRGVEALRWLCVDRPLRLSSLATPIEGGDCRRFRVEAFAADAETTAGGQAAAPIRFARAELELASTYPPPDTAPPALLAAPLVAGHPYDDAALFHGPSLRVIERLTVGSNGATAILRADASRVAPGVLPIVVLDGIAQCVGGDLPRLGMPDWPAGALAVPVSFPDVRLFAPIPTHGELRCEIRRMDGERPAPGALLPFMAHLYKGQALCATVRLDARLVPGGRPGRLPPAERRAFLVGERYVTDGRVADLDGEAAAATHLEVARLNWLPGTLEHVYRTDAQGPALTREVVGKDLVAHLAQVPPGTVRLPEGTAGNARTTHHPFHAYPVALEDVPGGARARTTGPAALDLSALAVSAARRTGVEGFFMTDVWCALVAHTLRRFALRDPDGFAVSANGPMLFLANHQTGVESVSFCLLLSALTGRDVAAVAKAEHRDSWIGRLHAHAAAYPGISLPRSMLLVERERPDAMLALLKEAGKGFAREGGSLLVHVEGTRARRARHRIAAMSGTWLDLALSRGVPVVPVRFAGGLPVEERTERLEFGWRFARQDIIVGSPLGPDVLRALSYAERNRLVIDAIHALGPLPEAEEPNPPDPDLERAVADAATTYGFDPIGAAIAAFVRRWPAPGAQTAHLLAGGPDGPCSLYGDRRDAWLAASKALLFGAAAVEGRRS